MYWLDTTILVLLGLGAVLGARSGLVKQIARIAGFFAALAGAVCFHGAAADYLQRNVLQGADAQVAGVGAYVGVFVGIYLAFFLTAVVVEKFLKAVKLNGMNRLMGAAAGAGKAALLVGALCLAAISFPNPGTQDVMRQSRIAPALAGTVGLGLRLVPEQYTADLRAGFDQVKQAADAPPTTSEDVQKLLSGPAPADAAKPTKP
jgi:uncharacterized membrane protein required for colicin V production